MPDPSNVVPFPTPNAQPVPGDGMASQGPNGYPVDGAIAIEVDGKFIEIDENGGLYISDGGNFPSPAVISHDDDSSSFGDNIATQLPPSTLMNIADDFLQGIQADEMSRSEMIDQYNTGIDLLGLKIEDVSSARTQKQSVSKVGNPLMLEAMVRYHSGAVAEMLPSEGPVKAQTIGNVTSEEEQLAADFQADFNYFLTDIAKEFYPDSSRGFMHQGYAGQMYKKIYRDAMRQRPVSESVSVIDLIVSEEANDLDTAQRVTHQFFPTRSQVRRMQIVGRYLDVELGQPTSQLPSGTQRIRQSEGLNAMAQRPQDLPFNFYECDSDVDVGFYDINLSFERGAPEGLPLPYKVTFDKDSRQVLGIWRNWKDGDPLFRKRNMYVKYGFVPGLGFHDWGFLQLLGNQTRALRGVWRLLLDAGMFSNFPGGVKVKNPRTSTNEISPGPGEFVDIDLPAGINDIRQVLMALPYQKIDAVFIQFAQMIEESAMRLGGTVMMETGEGRTNVPVGTMMSMIEQQTQVMAGIHKRNHSSQKDELLKLRELFAENPQDLWRLARDPKRRWETSEEFMNLNIVPASDPNTPSQIHRIMKAAALMEIVKANPQEYDVRAVNQRVLRTINEASPDELLLPPGVAAQNAAAQAQAQGGQQPGAGAAQNDPSKLAAVQQRGQQQQEQHQFKMQELATDQAGKERDRQLAAQAEALESSDRAADRASREKLQEGKIELEHLKLGAQQTHQAHERAHKDRLATSQEASDAANIPVVAPEGGIGPA